MATTKITKEEIKLALIEALGETHLTADSARIERIEAALLQHTMILTGNSNPANGLVVKVDRVEQAIVEIKEAKTTRSAREWGILLIALGLFTTSIWNIIAK